MSGDNSARLEPNTVRGSESSNDKALCRCTCCGADLLLQDSSDFLKRTATHIQAAKVSERELLQVIEDLVLYGRLSASNFLLRRDLEERRQAWENAEHILLTRLAATLEPVDPDTLDEVSLELRYAFDRYCRGFGEPPYDLATRVLKMARERGLPLCRASELPYAPGADDVEEADAK